MREYHFNISSFVDSGGEDIPGIGQYEDFHTIDWQRDIARDRMRHRYIVKKVQDSVWDFIKVNNKNYLGLMSRREMRNIKTLFILIIREHMMHGLVGYVYY